MEIFVKVYKLNKKILDKACKASFWCGLLLFSSTTAAAQYLDGDTHAWGSIEYNDDPWVFRVSRKNLITEGLLNRHVAVWASHGRYYDNDKGFWKWQRPYLFGTTEDLFTQTIVVPYLIPMLENAGAVVFTPRERDWQKNEIIVDNDDATSSYQETNNGKKWKSCDSIGFRNVNGILHDGENPFQRGTVRQTKTSKKKKISTVSYRPNFQESGKYAVYVSYQTLPKSVKDAQYFVIHKGIKTEFTVNQTMGSGTWVYLGTFDFDKGYSDDNQVILTNYSSHRGVVTTDAVRFGGGMGNIERGGSLSGLPRCLEGARYYAQWAGAPYSVYSGRHGSNDYADDINSRSLMTNWLAGGSVYVPSLNGKKVPIELSLAVHSDAGYAPNGKDITGSLAICTTEFNDCVLNSGISRMASYDFAEALLKNIKTDIIARYHTWNNRYLWDKNYSETRLPAVPSAIIEMLSHQSFPDMKLSQDPWFKFTIARSIYKTILRFINSNHGKSYKIQPLPPQNFGIQLDDNGKATLKWSEQFDLQEKTAVPSGYIVYTSIDNRGFDNGTYVNRSSMSLDLQPGLQYSFKITAVNSGGESFPSETLSATYNSLSPYKILIVNNFHRLASPQVVDNDRSQGFDFNKDEGVSYGLTAGWNGKQICFDKKKMGKEGPGGLGYCGNEMAGQFVMGNTFDYPVEHIKAIKSNPNYSVTSCSAEYLINHNIELSRYNVVDIICGQEKYDGYTPEYYKTFTPELKSLISQYQSKGGKLLVSGSYVGSDMSLQDDKEWFKSIFHAEPVAADSLKSDGKISGLGMTFSYYNALNDKHYASTHSDILMPNGDAICAMKYSDENPAAVAFKDEKSSTFVMGFPFECIKSDNDKKNIMQGILNYLLH